MKKKYQVVVGQKCNGYLREDQELWLIQQIKNFLENVVLDMSCESDVEFYNEICRWINEEGYLRSIEINITEYMED